MLSQKQLKRKSMFRSALRLNIQICGTSNTKLVRSNSQESIPTVESMNTLYPADSSSVYDGLSKDFIDTARSDSITTATTSESSYSDKSGRSSWVTLESPKSPFLSNNNNNETKKLKNIRKKVQFCKMVKVILIPTRREFSVVASDLWWNFDECESFKKEAYHEMKAFVEKYCCTVKDGIFALYQPHEDCALSSTSTKNNNKPSTPPHPPLIIPTTPPQSSPVTSTKEKVNNDEKVSIAPLKVLPSPLIDTKVQQSPPPSSPSFSNHMKYFTTTSATSPVATATAIPTSSPSTMTQMHIPSSPVPKFQLIRSSTNGSAIRIPSRLYFNNNNNNNNNNDNDNNMNHTNNISENNNNSCPLDVDNTITAVNDVSEMTEVEADDSNFKSTYIATTTDCMDDDGVDITCYRHSILGSCSSIKLHHPIVIDSTTPIASAASSPLYSSIRHGGNHNSTTTMMTMPPPFPDFNTIIDGSLLVNDSNDNNNNNTTNDDTTTSLLSSTATSDIKTTARYASVAANECIIETDCEEEKDDDDDSDTTAAEFAIMCISLSSSSGIKSRSCNNDNDDNANNDDDSSSTYMHDHFNDDNNENPFITITPRTP